MSGEGVLPRERRAALRAGDVEHLVHRCDVALEVGSTSEGAHARSVVRRWDPRAGDLSLAPASVPVQGHRSRRAAPASEHHHARSIVTPWVRVRCGVQRLSVLMRLWSDEGRSGLSHTVELPNGCWAVENEDGVVVWVVVGWTSIVRPWCGGVVV